jgi:hypothetical protein
VASGNVVGIIGDITQPTIAYATFDIRLGGSGPFEVLPLYDYDDTSPENLDFDCRLEGYGGGGLTISWDWSATTATTGDVRWGAAIRRIEEDVEDIDTTQIYDYNYATDTTASASGERSRVSIAFTNGADMDSLANGEAFIIRVIRDAINAADTMVGDAELWAWTICVKET